MPSNVISVRDLEEEDVKLLESLAEFLRAKRLAAAGKTAESEEDSFERSAGSWAGLVDGEELIRKIYADRLISTRPEAKL
ncbi:MAG: hypothetical protein P4L55_03875 [Syntrophobacteraceae bacterium]|nr:hypothetical protein [Syntrophobacteraceae bacterium]